MDKRRIDRRKAQNDNKNIVHLVDSAKHEDDSNK